jgi:hypothetical protein
MNAMRQHMVTAAALMGVLGSGGFAWAVAQDAGPAAVAIDDAVQAIAPVGVRRVLLARPFRVDEPWADTWRAERPAVAGGWMLVLEVDPELVRPRQVAMPVLYAGRTTAARVNVGHESGRLVVLVPDAIGDDGRPVTRLEDLPIWFGDADLPERITAERAADARRRADAAGITPRPAAELAAAADRGRRGATLDAAGVARHPDRLAVMLEAMRLVKRYAPDEAELADGWLVFEPEAGAGR